MLCAFLYTRYCSIACMWHHQALLVHLGTSESLYQFLVFASDLEKAFNIQAQFDKGSFVLLVLTFCLMFLHCEFDCSI